MSENSTDPNLSKAGAVSMSGADWNEQAAKSAESYLNSGSFSRGSLIDQLIYEGFSESQATFGVTEAGL